MNLPTKALNICAADVSAVAAGGDATPCATLPATARHIDAWGAAA